MSQRWISDRAHSIEASGIRKVFELARDLQDPINLSIGLPDFDVPGPVKDAAHAAIDGGMNAYTVTQGLPELRTALARQVRERYPDQDRAVMVTSGTSGGLLLSLMAAVNPGDEVILFDPYFVSYPQLVRMAGGTPVVLDTYPDFRIDPERVASAITPRTKAILFSSPANPTGVTVPPATLRRLAEVARERDVLLISDEIYREFYYDEPFASVVEYEPDALAVDGLGKSHGMTGWRIGFAHGPRELIEEMTKIQQFTFVCAPSAFQHAAVAALSVPMGDVVAEYRRKRDFVVEALSERFRLAVPGGAFYVFPQAPWGTATEFVSECIRNNLLVIPGCTFGLRDTHFRVSYAATQATLERGVEVLNRLAKRG